MVRLSDEVAKPYEDATPAEWLNEPPNWPFDPYPCPTCDGYGDVLHEPTDVVVVCPDCDGLGELP